MRGKEGHLTTPHLDPPTDFASLNLPRGERVRGNKWNEIGRECTRISALLH